MFKVLRNISFAVVIVGLTLLISKGFVYKELIGLHVGTTQEFEYYHTIWQTKVNIEGIIITSVSLVLFVIFAILERKMKK